jgi:transcriptional regulator with XRE-family HTH domain
LKRKREPNGAATTGAGAYQGRQPGTADLLDALIKRLELKNDAELSRLLEVEAPTISKLRNGKLSIGASMLLRMHRVSNVSVKELRALMGDRRDVFRGAVDAKLR